MLDAVQQLSPPRKINTLQLDVQRQMYITEANNVGSIPPTATPKSTSKAAKGASTSMSVLLDKLGERLRVRTHRHAALRCVDHQISGPEQRRWKRQGLGGRLGWATR